MGHTPCLSPYGMAQSGRIVEYYAQFRLFGYWKSVCHDRAAQKELSRHILSRWPPVFHDSCLPACPVMGWDGCPKNHARDCARRLHAEGHQDGSVSDRRSELAGGIRWGIVSGAKAMLGLEEGQALDVVIVELLYEESSGTVLLAVWYGGIIDGLLCGDQWTAFFGGVGNLVPVLV